MVGNTIKMGGKRKKNVGGKEKFWGGRKNKTFERINIGGKG